MERYELTSKFNSNFKHEGKSKQVKICVRDYFTQCLRNAAPKAIQAEYNRVMEQYGIVEPRDIFVCKMITATTTTVVTIPDFKFGVEIEFYGVTREEVAYELCQKGIQTVVVRYGHDVSSTWKITTDSSVGTRGEGWEIVSPILQGTDGLKQLKVVCQVLKDLEAKVDSTCGTHIHIDARTLNLEEMKSIGRIYNSFSDKISRFVGASRLTSKYCLPIETNSTFFDLVSTRESLASATYRYSTVNYAAYLRHGTIEFRQLEGTYDYNKIENWISFLMSIVEASKDFSKVNQIKTLNGAA